MASVTSYTNTIHGDLAIYMTAKFFVAFSNPESVISRTIQDIITRTDNPNIYHLSSMHDPILSSAFLARPPIHASRIYADESMHPDTERLQRWNALSIGERDGYESLLRDMHTTYIYRKQQLDLDAYKRDCGFLSLTTTRAAIFELFPKTGFGPDINHMICIANLIGFIQGINTTVRKDQPIRIMCVSSRADYLAEHIALNGMDNIIGIIIDPDNNHISELPDIIDSFTLNMLS